MELHTLYSSGTLSYTTRERRRREEGVKEVEQKYNQGGLEASCGQPTCLQQA